MLDLDNEKLQTLVTTANGAIELRIPLGTGVLALELVKVNLFTEDFKVETNQSNGEDVGADHGIHYRGIIKGDNNSLAVFSFFKDEVIGLVL
jgi:hypothetical protein